MAKRTTWKGGKKVCFSCIFCLQSQLSDIYFNCQVAKTWTGFYKVCICIALNYLLSYFLLKQGMLVEDGEGMF